MYSATTSLARRSDTAAGELGFAAYRLNSSRELIPATVLLTVEDPVVGSTSDTRVRFPIRGVGLPGLVGVERLGREPDPLGCGGIPSHGRTARPDTEAPIAVIPGSSAWRGGAREARRGSGRHLSERSWIPAG